MKKILFLLSVLLFIYRENSYAMAAVSELGLSAVSATMDAKSVENGLSNVAKDQTKEWLSSSVGGLEKMILQNSEAEIHEATEKIFEIVNIVQSIEKIAIEMTNGNYDTAAIEATDQIVGKVNHPLVSATWSAVKLTYESHKLVQSTEDARQVEILYHMVTHDRMLLGVSDPSSSMPPQIPVNTRSADYFFNKYIMTNDSARRALKAYVTTVLSQEWPEQSWSEWLGSFRTIGMGLDTKKNAELAMLDQEWRNKGRTWVMSVIKEMNKQARVSWAELKLRQELAAFKEFSKSVISFKTSDLPQMLRDFQEIQTFKNELPLYKKELLAGMKLRQETKKKISSLNKKSFSKYASNSIENIIALSSSWETKMRIYSARVRLLQEKSLIVKFDKESDAWRAIGKEAGDFVLMNGESAADELVKEVIGFECKVDPNLSGTNSAKVVRRCRETKAQSQRYFKMYEAQFEPFTWDFKVEQEGSFYIPKDIKLPSDSEAFAQELLKVLNRGEMRLAGRMYSAWHEYSGIAFIRYSSLMKRASMGYFEYEEPKDLPKYDNTEERTVKSAGWRMAKSAIWNKAKVTYFIEIEKFNRKRAPILQMMNSFKELEAISRVQWGIYSNAMYKILAFDEKITMAARGGWLAVQSKCNQNAYTKLPRLDKDIETIFGVIGALPRLAYKIKSSPACPTPEGLVKTGQEYKKLIDMVSIYIQEYKKLPKLQSSDIKAMALFSGSIFRIKQDKERVLGIIKGMPENFKRIKKIETNIKRIRASLSPINQMIPISTRDLANRQQDIFWLNDKSQMLESFIAYMVDSKKIKRKYGLAVVLPKDFKVQNGMIYTNIPYPHYLGANEISIITDPLKTMYTSSEAKRFLSTHFPKAAQNFDDVISMKEISPAKENIFIWSKVVYLKDLQAMKLILKNIKVHSNNFDEKIESIPSCFPSIKDSRKYYFEDKYIDKKEFNKTSLGKMFLSLRNKVKELFVLRKVFLVKEGQRVSLIQTEIEGKKLEEEASKKAKEQMEKEEAIANAKIQKIQAIENLYSQFAQNYSSRSLSSLMSLISDDWESSSDGTTLMDLEETLENSFSIFDEVVCNIYSLNITNIGENRYRVNYVINIKGFIYDDDIEHNEKSSVTEEIVFINGSPKIFKTLSGKYWNRR